MIKYCLSLTGHYALLYSNCCTGYRTSHRFHLIGSLMTINDDAGSPWVLWFAHCCHLEQKTHTARQGFEASKFCFYNSVETLSYKNDLKKINKHSPLQWGTEECFLSAAAAAFGAATSGVKPCWKERRKTDCNEMNGSVFPLCQGRKESITNTGRQQTMCTQ